MLSREMSFLEKFCSLTHEEMRDCCATAIHIELQGLLDYSDFLQAVQVAYNAHPLLRMKSADDKISFVENTSFDSLPIQHFITNREANKDQLLQEHVARPHNVQVNFWRIMLVTMPKAGKSFISVACSHAIMDGTSILWLLGDILRSSIALNQGKAPNLVNYDLPPRIDDLIDNSHFTPGSYDYDLKPNPFTTPTTVAECSNVNFQRIIEKDVLEKLLKQSKENGINISYPLIAAFTLSCYQHDQSYCKNERCDVMLPFNQRPYCKESLDPTLLAYYIDMVPFHTDFKQKRTFWELAKHIEEEANKAIKAYEFVTYDNKTMLKDFYQLWYDNVANNQFTLGHAFSQIGRFDDAFADIEEYYPIKNIHIKQLLRGMLYRMSTQAISVNNRLYLSYNVPTPAMDLDIAESIADEMVEVLNKIIGE